MKAKPRKGQKRRHQTLAVKRKKRMRARISPAAVRKPAAFQKPAASRKPAVSLQPAVSVLPVKQESRDAEKWEKELGKSYDTGYNAGYDNGYNAGFNEGAKLSGKGYDQGYEEGFAKGLYAGGDEIVDHLLPYHMILPQYTVKDIVERGLAELLPEAVRLMSAEEVKARIIDAMDRKLPLSVVRLGDGELLTMAQELVMSVPEVKKRGSFLEYAGVRVPDRQARDLVAAAVGRADIVGVPKLRLPNFLPLLVPVFQAHGLDFRTMPLTLSTINYELESGGHWGDILRGRRVLAVGNKAGPLTEALAKRGIETEEPIAEVRGIHDFARVVAEAGERTFDIALVAAGIPSVVICQRLASDYGKVAFDFGHLADSIVKGETPFR